MISNFARVVSTAFIWLMMPLIVGMAAGGVRGVEMVALVTIVCAIAAWTTRAIWTSGIGIMDEEKAKRVSSRRVQHLLRHMTEAELDEMRARLMADEQAVPLESLLASRDYAERR